MSEPLFPLEKIFGSRTRIKVITLFTTGIKRPYYVREISRIVDERLNAVRRELEILRKVGMLATYAEKRRKYYTFIPSFILAKELTSIMKKAGPKVEDSLFKNIDRIGEVKLLVLSGYFTNANTSPTDLLIVGKIDEKSLHNFIQGVERQINHEVSYTPLTESEYKYRLNFNDMFLRQIFSGSYKEIINKLPDDLQPSKSKERQATATLIKS